MLAMGIFLCYNKYMSEIKSIWKDIISCLQAEISSAAYEIYFMDLEPIAIDGESLVVLCQKPSKKRVIENSYAHALRTAVLDTGALIKDVKIILPEDQDKYKREEPDADDVEPKFSYIIFNKSYTFENFVVGESNRIAASAALAVSENPGQIYNPLFIYGHPGLGKTHILHAIGNELLANNPQLKVLYTTAENFTNDYTLSIAGAKNKEIVRAFKQKYRELDVLMIDDVQFFEKTEKTQEELFHIFNDLYDIGKQIILSSDRPIRNLRLLDDRLSSRFAAGITVDIAAPDLETRIAILEKKALSFHYLLPPEVAYYLANKEQNNIRVLEGMLKTVGMYAMLKQLPITLALAKEALRESEAESVEHLSVQKIISRTCQYFGITEDEIFGKRRTKKLVEPRQFAMYLITCLIPTVPLSSIGQTFGRDHTTVINARDKIAQLRNEKDERTCTIIDDLIHHILES